MPRIFSVTPILNFNDKELPAHFTFDVPIKGNYYFVQDSDEVFLYIEGRTEADTITVEGKLILEGDDIPDQYITQLVLSFLLEEEIVWATIVTKNPVSAGTAMTGSNHWKKKF